MSFISRWFVFLSVFLSGCATLTEDAMVPIAFSFSDGSSGQCTLTNKQGSWLEEVPSTVRVRKFDDNLEYDCRTSDGRQAIGSLESTMNIWESLISYNKAKDPAYKQAYLNAKTNQINTNYNKQAELAYQQNLLNIQQANELAKRQQDMDFYKSFLSKHNIDLTSPAVIGNLSQIAGPGVDLTTRQKDAATGALIGTPEYAQRVHEYSNRPANQVNINHSDTPMPILGSDLINKYGNVLGVDPDTYYVLNNLGQLVPFVKDTPAEVTKLESITDKHRKYPASFVIPVEKSSD